MVYKYKVTDGSKTGYFSTRYHHSRYPDTLSFLKAHKKQINNALNVADVSWDLANEADLIDVSEETEEGVSLLIEIAQLLIKNL